MALIKYLIIILYFHQLINSQNCLQYTNQTKNLVVNGDFSNHTCKLNTCIYKPINYTLGQYVASWYPNPDIEIGKGFLYNSVITNIDKYII